MTRDLLERHADSERLQERANFYSGQINVPPREICLVDASAGIMDQMGPNSPLSGDNEFYLNDDLFLSLSNNECEALMAFTAAAQKYEEDVSVATTDGANQARGANAMMGSAAGLAGGAAGAATAMYTRKQPTLTRDQVVAGLIAAGGAAAGGGYSYSRAPDTTQPNVAEYIQNIIWQRVAERALSISEVNIEDFIGLFDKLNLWTERQDSMMIIDKDGAKNVAAIFRGIQQERTQENGVS